MKETDLISIKKLKSWGLLNIIKRETIIDKLISNFLNQALKINKINIKIGVLI